MTDDIYSRLEQRVLVLEKHANEIAAWKTSVEENTEVQREVVSVGKDIIAAMRVMGWVGNGIKWLAAVGAAAAVIFAAFKGWVNG